MKSYIATTTVQITARIHKMVKRRAEKRRSKIMPYVESLLVRGMKDEDAEESAAK